MNERHGLEKNIIGVEVMDRTQADIQSIVLKKSLFEPFVDSTVFVTGATGLIGSMLVKTLLSANETYGFNINVIGQIRNREKARSIFGDLINKVELTTFDDVPCNFIFHTVSPTTSQFFIEHPVETIKTSVGSTISILEVAKKNKATMIYLSSMEQYGIPYEDGEIMTEGKVGVINHLNVRSSYSESKRLCECLCASYAAEYNVNVKIARLAQTFGAGVPLIDNRMPMQFARAASAGNNIVLHTEGESVSNFVYLTDAIVGLLMIIEKGVSGHAYNICNDKETKSVREIAEMVASNVANGNIDVRIERKENMGYAPDVKMYLNSEKLRGLGWFAEVDMIEAYRRMVAYLRGDDF